MWQSIWHFFHRKKKKTTVKVETFTANELVRTPVLNLEQGMYVSELDRPWLESPFKFQGFTIETGKDLQSLREVCQYVHIDVSKQKKRKVVKRKNADHFANNKLIIGKSPERLGAFDEEIPRARLNYKAAGKLVADFMGKVANGEGIDGTLAKAAVAECVNSVLHSPDALLWLSQLKDKDQYTAQHSLNVCVLSIILGRHIGFSELQLNHVGLCGMMHDMGKMLVPLKVLNKPGKLDPDELQVMQSHTTLGYELLKSSANMFHGAVETALTHHERMDGMGYPRRINANGLSYYSNIVAVVDMYDAMTSDRIYQTGITHYEATKILLNVAGYHLDTQLAIKFIECLGVYPPGCFVELNNGAIGLVVENNNQFKLRPKVLLILDKDKNFVEEQIIDLSDMLSDSKTATVSIRAIIKPADYRIDSKKYYQQGVIQKGFVNRK